jgi:hypothetical protein
MSWHVTSVSPSVAAELLMNLSWLVPKEKTVIAMAGPRTMYGLRAFLGQPFGPVMLKGCPVVEMRVEGFAITSMDHFTGG